MSKFGEKIRRATRREAAPMGFAALKEQRAPTMLVLALVDAKARKEALAEAANGADAAAVRAGHLEAGLEGLKALREAAPELPCGLWVRAAGREGVRQAWQAGADFIIYGDEETDAGVFLEEGVGQVLAVAPGATDAYLRMVEASPVEAVLVEGWEGPLTVRHSFELQRIGMLTRRPMVVPPGGDLDETQLQVLRDLGVAVVAVEAAAGATARLRELIQGLPARRRREDRAEPLLPQVAVAADEDEDDEGLP
ncbi:MAG TPA: hypothetical protein VIO14_04575 [Dehalococcoidia bacterium]